jgi:hypothetical protein
MTTEHRDPSLDLLLELDGEAFVIDASGRLLGEVRRQEGAAKAGAAARAEL